MKIKTTIRYHFTSTRLTVIKEMNVSNIVKVGENGTHILLVGCQTVQSLRKTVWEFFKILTIELAYEPAIFSWVYIYSRKMKVYVHIKTCT